MSNDKQRLIEVSREILAEETINEITPEYVEYLEEEFALFENVLDNAGAGINLLGSAVGALESAKEAHALFKAGHHVRALLSLASAVHHATSVHDTVKGFVDMRNQAHQEKERKAKMRRQSRARKKHRDTQAAAGFNPGSVARSDEHKTIEGNYRIVPKTRKIPKKRSK